MPLTACLAALWLAQGKMPAAFPEKLESKHYELKTSATREQGQDLLDFMELLHQTYTSLLKPDNPAELEKRRFTILLHKDAQEYFKSGAPAGSGAYYDPSTKRLVGFYDETFMKPFFAHEGMHQFTDATSKNFFAFNMWFTEGIADCIGNCEVRNKKLFMCVKSGIIARMRLPTIQAAIRAGVAPHLERLMTLPKTVFMRNAELCYAMSWSFCHFLMTFPKDEDRGSQIPDGRYRKNLAGYYEIVRAGGSTHERAWSEAFKGFPMGELEEEWKKYVLGLDSGKLLGLCRELTEEELSRAGAAIEPGSTGILLAEVTADGAAARGGLQAGDIVLKFDGKRFLRHEAMNRLNIWLQELPYGRAAPVLVLRDGREVEAACTWEAPKKK